jgi:hypothetical protein
VTRALIAPWVGGVLSAPGPPQAPKLGPEEKRIGYFAGNWPSEGEMKESAFGPAGKATSTEHNEWLPGGIFLVFHAGFKALLGNGKGLAVMGYDRGERVYTYDASNSIGMSGSVQGRCERRHPDLDERVQDGGKPMKSRYSIKELSPKAYIYKEEWSPDDKRWSTVEEGMATKAK